LAVTDQVIQTLLQFQPPPLADFSPADRAGVNIGTLLKVAKETGLLAWHVNPGNRLFRIYPANVAADSPVPFAIAPFDLVLFEQRLGLTQQFEAFFNRAGLCRFRAYGGGGNKDRHFSQGGLAALTRR
jgi:hypothetical protein